MAEEYIERDGLIGAIRACKAMMNMGVPKQYMTQKDMMQIIKRMPAADVVEVVHGRWTKNHHVSYDDMREENVHWYTYTCSKCGGEAMNDYPYCPNCGARMDGET